MNNSEFLRGLMKRADGSLQAWFDAEHVDGTNGDGDGTNGIADGSPLVDELGEITHEVSELMKKQPYTFDVHDVPGSLRTVGRYIDELTAERDEWMRKADKYRQHMWEFSNWHTATAKLLGIGIDPENLPTDEMIQDEIELRIIKLLQAEAKSAKRSAAVERLRNCLYTSDSDLMRAMLNWGHEPHTGDDSRFALIDLLTDEDAHSKAQSKDAPTLSDLYGVLSDEKVPETPDFAETPQKSPEQGQESDAFDDLGHSADMSEKSADCVRSEPEMSENDSREKLEADVRCRFEAFGESPLCDEVFGWLDRQAAIAKREWAHVHDAYIADVRGERDAAEARAAELQAKLDEYEDRAEAFTLLTNGTMCVGSKQLVARIAELQKQVERFTARLPRECVDCELGHWAEVDRLTDMYNEANERVTAQSDEHGRIVGDYEATVDNLKAEIAKRDKGIERLKRQRDEARAQLENLATDLAECGREREIYRDACGRLLDLADEMRLVRLDGCGPALVDERGEVVS